MKSSPLTLIAMSNALVKAGQGLSLPEKRIVMLAISKLDSRQPITNLVPITRITAREYADLTQCDMPTAYQALQSAGEQLFKRKITFHKITKKGVITTEMRWVGRCTYQAGEGWAELAWWPELLPCLLDLKKQFTTYHLQQATALRSVYSWRLMELLMRFKNSGWAEYNLKDFCNSMEATEKQRLNFANIRRRIIEPAVNELIKKDHWNIKWFSIKEGRRVVRLKFIFSHHIRS
ncbi:replication initiation protein [Formicincola oecophyllae]|uniref:replication initiation protein n=1 Tax=Formicincola oecophyllae TaxID=2558361 RepID=UPI0019D16BFD|nr:replication initiation protein [Formicincola oecophyllae]